MRATRTQAALAVSLPVTLHAGPLSVSKANAFAKLAIVPVEGAALKRLPKTWRTSLARCSNRTALFLSSAGPGCSMPSRSSLGLAHSTGVERLQELAVSVSRHWHCRCASSGRTQEVSLLKFWRADAPGAYFSSFVGDAPATIAHSSAAQQLFD